MEIKLKTKIFDDNTMLIDSLNSQNNIINNYSFAITQSTSTKTKEQLINLVNDELAIELELFIEQENRKLTSDETVTSEVIEKFKSKYTES